ncbi:hypothetical protein [Streptomyces sp. NPDC059994]|uniref:hypothetical protein n=1 Tax=Streptomyces sp. NPDC059994 TaxID=3347029 RepID=UPI0036A55B1C
MTEWPRATASATTARPTRPPAPKTPMRLGELEELEELAELAEPVERAGFTEGAEFAFVEVMTGTLGRAPLVTAKVLGWRRPHE